MLIAVTGKAGSGKSEVARILHEMQPGSLILSFAAPVKRIAKEFYGWDGEKDASGRRLLQDIATAGRRYNSEIWVNCMLERINMVQHNLDVIIIDDLRFLNEAKLVRNFQGKIIKVYGRGHDLGIFGEHQSETELTEIEASLISNFPYETIYEVTRKLADLLTKWNARNSGEDNA